MPVEHENITDAELHEMKGAAGASINEVPHSDGAGGSVWNVPMPTAGWKYSAIGSGTTFTTPTSYSLINVVGADTVVMADWDNNDLGRLTYSGSLRMHGHFVFDITFKHSSGSGQDCFFDVFQDGSTASFENVVSADNASYNHVAFHADVIMTTNSYIEMFCKVSSGNIIIHTAYMFCMGMVMAV